MTTIRVGIIGAGAIARNHVNGINGHAKAEVVAIADKSEARAKAVAKEAGVQRVYTSARQLIADKDIDAVSICLPNKFHAPCAIAALEAGKHVSLDKPFALSATEARAVLAAAKKKRRVFTLGMNWRFTPGAQRLKAMVTRGDLGDVYHAKAFMRRRHSSPVFGTWFCRKSLSGGGALLDIGVHVLDACLYAIDNFEPVTVSGATYTKFGNRGIGEGGWGHSDPGKHVFDVDDFGSAFIKMKNGATVCLDASWVLHQEEPGRQNVELFGTEAGASMMPLKLFRFGKRKGEYEVIEPQGLPLRYPHGDRFHNWLDAIVGDDTLEVKPEQALAIQKILDAIYLSSKSGKEVRIR